MTIPKNIFQTWKTKKLDPEYLKWQSSWTSLNPEFKYYFYNDRDCFKFVYRNYPEYIELYESLKPVEKADVFRYLVLHKYGGVYVDIDTECLKPIKDLVELFPNSVITGFEYENPVQYLQWFIACPQGHNTMIELVDEIYRRSWYTWCMYKTENQMTYYLTGPEMFTYILKKTNHSVSILPKGRLGCYDTRLIDRNSYLIHYFSGSWKKRKCAPIKKINANKINANKIKAIINE